VVLVANSIKSIYDKYKSAFENGGAEQTPDMALSINLIMMTTMSELQNIAFNSKQQISVILDLDTSPILLASKYYGFSEYNLQRFIDENSLSLDELLLIKKDREVSYYI